MQGIKVTFSRRAVGEGGRDQGSQVKVEGRFILTWEIYEQASRLRRRSQWNNVGYLIELDPEEKNISTCGRTSPGREWEHGKEAEVVVGSFSNDAQ